MDAIIDDLAGRRCASLLGIPVRGTLGIVLAAKKRGLIPQARPVIETLIRSGMYLSRSVIEEALLRVNE
jgi:predicted nucleic acid-binding protein